MRISWPLITLECTPERPGEESGVPGGVGKAASRLFLYLQASLIDTIVVPHTAFSYLFHLQ